jgi:hypothetical protein
MTGPRLALAGLVFALAPIAGAAGAGVAARSVVKNVNGRITALSMDGSRVAYATQSFAPTGCDKVFVWDVASGAGTLVSGPKTGTCGGDEPDGQLVSAVAIAGNRLAWIRTGSGNTETDDYLFSATLPKPREVQLASAVATGTTGGGALGGGWLGGLVGSGTVVAVNTWSTDVRGAVTQASLKTVGARLTTIASGPLTLTAESVDTGRIAVARTDGSVAIYTATGTLLQTVAPPSFAAIALRNDLLVVLTKTKTLNIYSARTGVFIRSWPIPAGAAHLDVFSDIAVYSVYRRLYGLQLTTGKQVVLAMPKRAIVAAQIEAPGVLYAYNSVKGSTDVGNIVLLSFADVKAALS